jgi:N-acetylglucosaminyl-diphospho-decaprenol L-rhamnosyltransferase
VTDVDVVVVSYNSRHHLRRCVEPLSGIPGVRVIVADNASPDGALETIADLPVTALALDRNGGFSFGCNHGWRAGRAPFVLFLNPDARIDPPSIRALAEVLESDERAAMVGPRIVDPEGSLLLSRRRFPTAASTFGRAFLLHRLLPGTSEVITDDGGLYARPGRCDWISGACMLVRRSILEQLGGLDEGFFMYCEDKDLARRIHDAGYEVRYEPSARCVHHEGASAPRPALSGVLTLSRVRYARKHGGRLRAALERGGLALLALTRMVASREPVARAGHAASLLVAAGKAPARPR